MAQKADRTSPLPRLKQGEKGSLVTQLQAFLKKEGVFAGKLDGIYGPETKKAVQAFQQAHGIEKDGIVGQQTWGLLRKVGFPLPPFEPEASEVSARQTKLESKHEQEPSIAQQAKAPEAEIGVAPTPKIVSDIWSKEDRLGYASFARALATLITHEDTHPPLTIGLKAPWGAGKTSLMRLVQYYLDGDMEKTSMAERQGTKSWIGAASIAVDGHWRPILTYKRLLAYLRNPKKWRLSIQKKANPGAKMGISARATVWFNAWKYQNSEQIWAGLAHSILSQVTSRLTPKKRELFWLQLHARRLDINQIRNKVYQAIFLEFLPAALAWSGAALLLIFFSLLTPGYYAFGPAILSIAPIWTGIKKWKNHARDKIKQQIQGSFRELIRAPNYEGKLGFLHLVESDIREVLDLIATPEHPLVIFIDDLDRCAPRHVSEVVEAINLFLAGDLPNCIFVIGMEPEMVAAAMEVANKDLLEKVKEFSISDEQTPLGWRFMEKIIQLPLTLPPPPPAGLSNYIDDLIGFAAKTSSDNADAHERKTASMPKIEEPEINESDVQEFMDRFRQEKDIRGVMQKSEDYLHDEVDAAKKAAAAEASKRVFAEKFEERDPLIRDFVLSAASQFQANPRKIKRYINLFRFVGTLRHNYTVDFIRLTGERPKMPSDEALTKYVTLSIQWPQAIGILTARSEEYGKAEKGSPSSIAVLEQKAKFLAASRKNPGKVNEEWETFLKANGFYFGDWVLSENFRQFLAVGASLSEYKGCGIW